MDEAYPFFLPNSWGNDIIVADYQPGEHMLDIFFGVCCLTSGMSFTQFS
jgi:hypothetical protein